MVVPAVATGRREAGRGPGEVATDAAELAKVATSLRRLLRDVWDDKRLGRLGPGELELVKGVKRAGRAIEVLLDGIDSYLKRKPPA